MKSHHAKFQSTYIPRANGRKPGARVTNPLGYLHPGKCEHSEVQSHPPLCNGRWMVFVVMRMRESSLISKIWRTTSRANTG